MLYLVIIVAILLLASGIHQYFNVDKKVKTPSIIYFSIGFVLYIVAILLYRTELLNSSTIIHEILLTTIFGLIIFWINSHRNKSSDTIYYTIIIILTIVVAILPLAATSILSLQTMFIVRLIFSVILLIIGVCVLYTRIKGKASESFPLLYLMAFIYWIAIAYWF